MIESGFHLILYGFYLVFRLVLYGFEIIVIIIIIVNVIIIILIAVVIIITIVLFCGPLETHDMGDQHALHIAWLLALSHGVGPSRPGCAAFFLTLKRKTLMPIHALRPYRV